MSRVPGGQRDQEEDRGETGFHQEYPSRCRGEAVCGLSLDLPPEGFQAFYHSDTWREEVGPVEKDLGY